MIDDTDSDDHSIEYYLAKLSLNGDANHLDNGNQNQDVNTSSKLNKTFYSEVEAEENEVNDDHELEMEMTKFRDEIASSTTQISDELKKRFGGGGKSKIKINRELFDQDEDDLETEELPSLVTDSWLNMTLSSRDSSTISTEHYGRDGDDEGGSEEGISEVNWDKSWNEIVDDKNKKNECPPALEEVHINEVEVEEHEISFPDHVNYLLHLMEEEKKIAELIPGAACEALQLENHTKEYSYGYFTDKTSTSSCGENFRLYGFIDKFRCMASYVIDSTFELRKQIITIGRGYKNDLRINDEHISRYVCEIELKVIDSGIYAYLHRLGGNCALCVDGELIENDQTVPLRNYAHIEVGQFKFGYRHFSGNLTAVGPVTRNKTQSNEFVSSYDGVD